MKINSSLYHNSIFFICLQSATNFCNNDKLLMFYLILDAIYSSFIVIQFTKMHLKIS